VYRRRLEVKALPARLEDLMDVRFRVRVRVRDRLRVRLRVRLRARARVWVTSWTKNRGTIIRVSTVNAGRTPKRPSSSMKTSQNLRRLL
jgi:hypothetical protein